MQAPRWVVSTTRCLEHNLAMATIDEAWWAALDPEWKGVFRKNLEFEGEPTPEILKSIAAATRINPAQSAVKSLAPLSDLPNLTHVDFSGCKSLTSTAGLPPSVQYLFFHWMAMEDLDWVDALPNLEKVYCDKALQTKVNRRIGANKRKRKG